MALFSHTLLTVAWFSLVALVPLALFGHKKELANVQRKEWLLLLGLALAGFALRWFVSPHGVIHTNFHGYEFLEFALTPDPPDQIVDRLPYGVGIYSFYRPLWWVLPRTDEMLFLVNSVLGALTPLALYFFIRLLGGSWKWALFSAGALCVLPPHVRLAPTESEMVPASFFFLFSLVAWTGALRSQNRLTSLVASLLLLFSVHMRILTVTFPLAFVLVAWVLHKRPLETLKRHWIAVAVLALGAIPQVAHVFFVVANEVRPDRATLPAFLNAPSKWLLGSNVLVFDARVVLPLLPGLFVASIVLLWKPRQRIALLCIGAVLFWGTLMMAFDVHILDALRYQYLVWPFWALPLGFVLEDFRRWARHLSGGWVTLIFALMLVALAAPNATWTRENSPLLQEYRALNRSFGKARSDDVWIARPGITGPVGPIPRLRIPTFRFQQGGPTRVALRPNTCPELLLRCAKERCITFVGLTDQVLYDGEEKSILEAPGGVPDELLRPNLFFDCPLKLETPVFPFEFSNQGPTPGPELHYTSPKAQVGLWTVLPKTPL